MLLALLKESAILIEVDQKNHELLEDKQEKLLLWNKKLSFCSDIRQLTQNIGSCNEQLITLKG